jgi:glycosyltransferase involved in cell wall biosynthesis
VASIAVYTDYRYRRTGGRVFAERAFALFLAELADHVDRMVILGKVDPQPGTSHYELPDTIDFVSLPYYESLTSPAQLFRGFLGSLTRYWRVLDDVDDVWLLGPHPLAIMFALLAAARGRSVTLGVRQDFRRYVRARHPNRRLIAVAGDLLEALWRVMSRRFPVVAVGPDLTALYPRANTLEISVSLVRAADIQADDDHMLDYEGETLSVLSVGRLEEEKNPLLLADIIAGLVRSDGRWRLAVCGEGPLEGALRQRLDVLGVAGKVKLHGYVPQDLGLAELYRSSHVLLHVSWTEGLPQVLYEAFAARVPVVATAVGGVRAGVGDAALLIEPGDAGAAVSAISALAQDAELRRRLVLNGIVRVRAHTLEAEAARVAQFITRGAAMARFESSDVDAESRRCS